MRKATQMISRRRFLGGSLAAASSVLALGSLRADEQVSDANSWVLLADTHIWQQRNTVKNGVVPAKNFEKACSEILQLRPRPAGLIIAGDCAVLQGDRGDYELLAELTAPLGQAAIPVHFVLGNHDNRENFFAVFPEAKPAKPPVPDKHVAIVETPYANWYLLDSLQRSNYTPGKLGEAQLAWLARQLDARPEKPALVVAHHNPDFSSKISGLEDTAALLEVLLPRRQVKAYFFGHTHRWELSKRDDLHLVNLTTLVWVFDKSQPRGWVRAQLQPNGIAMQFHALDRQHKAHGQTVTLQWRS